MLSFTWYVFHTFKRFGIINRKGNYFYFCLLVGNILSFKNKTICDALSCQNTFDSISFGIYCNEWI